MRADAGHRDLKPQNIFVIEKDDGPPRIRIGDFGLAIPTSNKGEGDGGSSHNSGINGREKHSIGVGTTSYAAPEQLGEHSHSGRGQGVYGAPADVYSFGLILFELFHGLSTEMERYLAFQRLRKGVPKGVTGSAGRKSTSSRATPSALDEGVQNRVSLLPSEFCQRHPVIASLVAEMTRLSPERRPTAAAVLRVLAEREKAVEGRASRLAEAMSSEKGGCHRSSSSSTNSSGASNGSGGFSTAPTTGEQRGSDGNVSREGNMSRPANAVRSHSHSLLEQRPLPTATREGQTASTEDSHRSKKSELIEENALLKKEKAVLQDEVERLRQQLEQLSASLR